MRTSGSESPEANSKLHRTTVPARGAAYSAARSGAANITSASAATIDLFAALFCIDNMKPPRRQERQGRHESPYSWRSWGFNSFC